MNCNRAKPLLSAYFDGELPSQDDLAVEEHIGKCDDCAAELRSYAQLASMAKALVTPPSPADSFEKFRREMTASRGIVATVPNHQDRSTQTAVKQHWRRIAVALAASVLVCLTWFAVRDRDHEHEQMASVFREYIALLPKDPNAAQQVLLTHYDGKSVDVNESDHHVGYHPLVARGLPAGYSVQNVYVMRMPCCTCVQCLCEREDGSVVAIFEHSDAVPEWFGDRPVSMENCGGSQCRLMELDQRFAASWRSGKRHMTMIGAKDKEEVDKLIAWFGQREKVNLE